MEVMILIHVTGGFFLGGGGLNILKMSRPNIHWHFEEKQSPLYTDSLVGLSQTSIEPATFC